jgi:hypothetical protein
MPFDFREQTHGNQTGYRRNLGIFTTAGGPSISGHSMLQTVHKDQLSGDRTLIDDKSMLSLFTSRGCRAAAALLEKQTEHGSTPEQLRPHL